MLYRQLSLHISRPPLKFTISENLRIFANITEITYSNLRALILKEYLPLAIAIGTEKFHSNYIITPILALTQKISIPPSIDQ
jgi:hypothetical protein